MTKKKRGRKKSETDKLASLLNEAAATPHETPEVLVPGPTDWVGSALEELRKVAATPRSELIEKAEQAFMKQARRVLKANEQYGLSLSGIVRTGAMFLLRFPLKRQQEN